MTTAWFAIRDKTMKRWKERWIERHPIDVGEATWNAIFSGGKEIRPSLFCELWSHLSDSKPNGDLAFAIECIHCASLILDDTPAMDNSDTRRGRPTIHKLLSTYKALWLAIEIMEMVFDIWKENEPSDPEKNAIWWNFIKDKCLQLVIGQYYDLTGTGDLHTLAVLKTGSLFEFATELVALQLALSQNAWRTWGRQLGVLFQWADDWSDLEEDKLAGNRNAFLESPDIIASHYKILLERSNIGVTWREKPFGNWLMSYFEEKGPLIDASNVTIPIPDVLVSDVPHKLFLDSFSAMDIVTQLFKRFTLYAKPSNLVMHLYNHYKSQIPDLIQKLSSTNIGTILSALLKFKHKIKEQTKKIWHNLQTESTAEAAIQTEFEEILAANGINSSQPHLLLLCDVLLS